MDMKTAAETATTGRSRGMPTRTMMAALASHREWWENSLLICRPNSVPWGQVDNSIIVTDCTSHLLQGEAVVDELGDLLLVRLGARSHALTLAPRCPRHGQMSATEQVSSCGAMGGVDTVTVLVVV